MYDVQGEHENMGPKLPKTEATTPARTRIYTRVLHHHNVSYVYDTGAYDVPGKHVVLVLKITKILSNLGQMTI